MVGKRSSCREYRSRRLPLGENTMQKRPVYPIHPGEILADELAELHKSPTELARELHVPANRISQLIAGKRSMTADTALRLEKWLGVSAAFWMNLQKRYELDVARDKMGDTLGVIKPIHSKKQPMNLQHELRP